MLSLELVLAALPAFVADKHNVRSRYESQMHRL